MEFGLSAEVLGTPYLMWDTGDGNASGHVGVRITPLLRFLGGRYFPDTEFGPEFGTTYVHASPEIKSIQWNAGVLSRVPNLFYENDEVELGFRLAIGFLRDKSLVSDTSTLGFYLHAALDGSIPSLNLILSLGPLINAYESSHSLGVAFTAGIYI